MRQTAAQSVKLISLKTRGFSLIELVFTLLLFGILVSVAFPSYQAWIAKERLGLLTYQVTSALNYARSEAIKHHCPVMLCASRHYLACDGSWSDGWLVLLGAYAETKTVDLLLKQYPALNEHEYLIWHGAGGRDYVQLNKDGSAYGHNGRFVVCIKRSSMRLASVVYLSATGRVRADKNLDFYRVCKG